MRTLILAVILALAAAPQAFCTGFMMPSDRGLSCLELESHRVSVSIRDQSAVTKVVEVFYNQHDRQLEATFAFPLPDGASVTDFKMYVGDKLVTGKITEAGEARAIYRQIVRQMRDPGLLEYMDARLLKLSVFPVPPRSRQEVRIEYSEALRAEEGLVEYVYPLKTPQAAARTLKDFTLAVDITAKAGVKNVYSPSHDTAISRQDDRHVRASFEKSQATLDKDFQLFYSLTDKAFGASLISYRKDDKEGYFLLLVSPKMDVAKSEVVPKDVVFVLDTSGSMQGEKLAQAERALTYCVSSLNEGDRFNVISFSDGTRELFDSPREARESSVKEAKAFIRDLRAEGGTDIESALKTSLKAADGASRSYMVVFLTDGVPTIGETEPRKILDAVKRDGAALARVFCFGVGYDVNAVLLDEIAGTTSATSQYVHPDEDIEVKVSTFYKKVGTPLLADVTLDFVGTDVFDVLPKRPGDLFRGSQIVMAGRYKRPGQATVVLKGRSAGGDMTLEYPVELAADSDSNGFVASIWAGRKIAYLLGQMRSHGEDKELKDEVVRLSKEFGIVTPYTSYLVTETPSVSPAPALPMELQRLRSLGYMSSAAPASPSTAASAPVGAASRDYGMMARAVEAREEVGETAVKASQAYSRLMANDKVRTDRRMTSASGRTFVNVDGVWVEARVTKDLSVVKVRFGSDAYFRIIDSAPALREAFALGERLVIKAGKYCLAIEDEGKESADDKDVKAVIAALGGK